ncbi:MAG: hypothetical protein AAGE80_16765 [Pseudomonadota bacterium]
MKTVLIALISIGLIAVVAEVALNAAGYSAFDLLGFGGLSLGR